MLEYHRRIRGNTTISPDFKMFWKALRWSGSFKAAGKERGAKLAASNAHQLSLGYDTPAIARLRQQHQSCRSASN